MRRQTVFVRNNLDPEKGNSVLAQLAEMDRSMIAGHRHTPYGETVIVKKDLIPAGLDVQPVGIEDLFVLMVREEEK